MTNMMISILGTGVIALVFYAFLSHTEGRRNDALVAWADSAGWRVSGGSARPHQVVAPENGEPVHPPAHGKLLLSLTGERHGRELTLQWIENDESGSTICYATLRGDHPASQLRRRFFAGRRPPQDRYLGEDRLPAAAREALADSQLDFMNVSHRLLTTGYGEWLSPKKIDTLLDETVAVCAVLDTAAPGTTAEVGEPEATA